MNVSLRTFRIFDTLPVEYIDLLAPIFKYYRCPSGTVILQQGKRADYLYLVVSGSAEVLYKPYDGDVIIISHIEQGELFGWSAVLGSAYYTSSILATEPLEAVRVRGRDLRKICSKNPEVGNDLLERLANSVSWRLANANAQVKSILAKGLRES